MCQGCVVAGISGETSPQVPDIDTDNVDTPKTRRKIEEALRQKLANGELSIEELLDLAEELDVEPAFHPEIPEDYHDEPGRPYLGSHQVRHPSELEKGKRYFLVATRNSERARIGFNFRGFEYNPENEKWYMLCISEEEPRSTGEHGMNRTALEGINLHPYLITQNGKVVDIRWEHSSWLEFAPPARDCDCLTQQPDAQDKKKTEQKFDCGTKGQHVCGHLGLVVH